MLPPSRSRSSSTVPYWSLVLFCPFACIFLATLPMTAGNDDAPVVKTESGLVSGVQLEVGGKKLDAYLGIPYAEPPVGDLRFRKPVPVSSWNGVYNATKKPLPCHQVPVPLLGLTKLNYSTATEDCLYLNVWKPSQVSCTKDSNCTKRLLPVVVYFHGGAFQWGDSALLVYDPANFVALTNVVFVTFNYRLGIFGFLSLETPEIPSNIGLWDQNLVLKWVRNNIVRFGGDPDQVTIGGQSAGGTSAALHAASPQSKGLFKRMFVQSGSPLSLVVNVLFRGEGKFINTAALLGCYDLRVAFSEQREDVVNCLRKLDASFVMGKLGNVDFLKQLFSPLDRDEFLPFSVLSSKPWQKLNVDDILLGTTTDEGSMFFSFLTDSFPQASEVLATQYRTVVTVVISQALSIPVSKAREVMSAYFGGHEIEYSFEEVRDIICEMFADVVFNCPAQLFADDAVQQGIQTHRYLFAYRSTHSFFPKWMGVAHTEDLFYTVGSLPFLKDKSRYTDALGSLGKKFLATQDYTSEEEEFMKDVVGAWGSFIHTGKPGIPRAGVLWPAYTADERRMLMLQPNNFTVVRDTRTDRCALWRPILYRNDEEQDQEVTSTTTTKPTKTRGPHSSKKKPSPGKRQGNGSSSQRNSLTVLSMVMLALVAHQLFITQ